MCIPAISAYFVTYKDTNSMDYMEMDCGNHELRFEVMYIR